MTLVSRTLVVLVLLISGSAWAGDDVSTETADVYLHPQNYSRRFLHVPVTLKGLCVAEAEWISRGGAFPSGDVSHTAETCPSYSNHTCTPDPLECHKLSEQYKIERTVTYLPQSKWELDGGPKTLDKFDRELDPNPDIKDSRGKHSAQIFSVNNEAFNICVYYYLAKPGPGFDPKFAPNPQKPIAVCKAPSVEWVNEKGEKPINPATGKPYQAPVCYPTVEGVDRELPTTYARLAPMSRDPLLKQIKDLSGGPSDIPSAEAPVATGSVKKVSYVPNPNLPHAQMSSSFRPSAGPSHTLESPPSKILQSHLIKYIGLETPSEF